MCPQSIYLSEFALNDAMGSVSHTLVLHVPGSTNLNFPEQPTPVLRSHQRMTADTKA
jgi:hypothetical protein